MMRAILIWVGMAIYNFIAADMLSISFAYTLEMSFFQVLMVFALALGGALK